MTGVFRDDYAKCPRCSEALDSDGPLLACRACRGVLIGEQKLVDMMLDAQVQALLHERKQPWARAPFVKSLDLVPPEVEEAALQCPRCVVQMEKHALYEVIVDRCPAHGVWLDGASELRDVLARAAALI